VKILIVGGGGREHTLVWKIRQSPLVRELFCAPGNAGIARIATCVGIDAADVQGLVRFAEDNRIDLTVVGPEVPLALGLADMLAERGLRVFGATKGAAEIESSKVFSKDFMRRHGIPTAAYRVFGGPEGPREAAAFLDGSGAVYPLVIKADGLAAGKGVVICQGRGEAHGAVRAIMEERIHGGAGDRIVIEEFLVGREASFFALTDGVRRIPLAICQDYKRVGDGDAGPNTGGMGAYCPSAHLDDETCRLIDETIVGPTLAGLASEGRLYRGILYTGLILTACGPRVLEYNARFGDPETQVLLPRMDSDLVPLLMECAAGSLEGARVDWKPASSVCVVAAAAGYPGVIRKGMPVRGIAEAEAIENVAVFCAGAGPGPGGEPIVSGGRVLAVSALGRDLADAIARAYEGLGRIHFDGMHYRRDIGRDALPAASRGALPPR
jgi:phosphoribosylamine--glycine ligase